jgi:hypothetical protein
MFRVKYMIALWPLCRGCYVDLQPPAIVPLQASITCIVVSAPVTGKVAQVSLERTLGTVTGGFLGEHL